VRCWDDLEKKVQYYHLSEQVREAFSVGLTHCTKSFTLSGATSPS
jgi:hypothetical protein